MKKYLTLSISFVLLISCNGFSAGSLPTITPEELEVEEYKIYKMVITQYISNDVEQIVINDHTHIRDENLSKLAKNVVELDEETIENFQDVNKDDHLLRNDFDLGIPCILLSSAESMEIFQPKTNGWDVFYERYPQSQGIMGVSKVGFNQEGNQALIYAWNEEYSEVGKGYYLFLTKEEGIWVIQAMITSWAS